jgi:hypothetical protein
VIALLTVFCQIETGGLDFFTRAKTEHGFDDISDNGSGDY